MLLFTVDIDIGFDSCTDLMLIEFLDTGKMDRSQFRDILHSTFDMHDDSLMDRMFRTFDQDSDGSLTCNEWLSGLWIYLKGNLNEQATYCFRVNFLE